MDLGIDALRPDNLPSIFTLISEKDLVCGVEYDVVRVLCGKDIGFDYEEVNAILRVVEQLIGDIFLSIRGSRG